ncbi:odorant receptor 131-2-like isoform X2 [Hyla sarda]|nr:odorant receptor 131-2-like isoform X2 [Hyla sarda]XP_056416273.1 odorant receptor 131-2-like isoform X2 [Hyla sarda]
MVNTSFYSNKTQVSYYNVWTTKNMQLIFLAVIFPIFCLCLLSVIVILCVFFTTSHIRENVRYLLFSHMLISDSLQLTLANTLFLAAIFSVYMPVKYCCIIVAITVTTCVITPYNLALMSLERYIAVCFPLRHGEICTVRRCNVAIIVIWVIGALPVLTEIIIMSYFTDKNFFSLKKMCIWRFLQIYKFQTTMRFLVFSLSFGIVVLIIFYTYIRVMLVARKIGSKQSSAFKATRTVLIHSFQLLLCLCSYTNIFTETLFKNHYAYMALTNFFVFTCLPQYISPFIYGIRDEVIRKCIRKLFCPP